MSRGAAGCLALFALSPSFSDAAPRRPGAGTPTTRRAPRPKAPPQPALRVTASGFMAPGTQGKPGPDLVTLTAAPGEHELASIVVQSTARIAPAVTLAGDARAGGSVIPRSEFGLAPQSQPYDGPGQVRYWLGVQVPLAAKPGLYRLPLRVSSGTQSRAVTVALNVLPFTLTGASKVYAVHFRPAPEAEGAEAADGMPEGAAPPPNPAGGADAELRGWLARLRSRGVPIVGFDRPVPEMVAALEAAREARFRGPVPRSLEPEAADAPARVTAAASAARERGLPPLMWIASAGSALDPALRAAVRESGGSIALLADALAAEGAAETGDAVIHSVHAPRVTEILHGPVVPPAARVEWLTWGPTRETPLRNRLYAGFLLWKSGFRGVYWPVTESRPFWSPASSHFRHLEGLGEGIDDARYLTVLFSLIRQVRDLDRRHPLPGKAEAEIRALLERLTPDATAAQVAAARRAVTARILALLSIVR